MAHSALLIASVLSLSFPKLTNGQNSTTFPVSSSSATVGTVNSGTTTSSRPVFTISAGDGENVLPNIVDPQAVNAQSVCPGYKAVQVKEDEHGLSAVLKLAGQPCNVYGTDVDILNLMVEYQGADRLAINISPANLDSSNSSFYIIPDDLIPRPKADSSFRDLDLEFNWNVTRHSTGDVLFTTQNSKLVYEDQFIEFVTALPNDYNLYGLGERIHGFRLNRNLTVTSYNADVGDPIDRNLYGTQPFYLETRYFETGGNSTLTGASSGNYRNGSRSGGSKYESYSHGVFLRNVHGQEVVLRHESLTWRLLGGSIDLFFFDGPTPAEVTKQYQLAAVGLPAMQSYWTLGFHQCRWGYRNWTETREIIDEFKAFNIPLETIWLDIDYMNQYRDFTLDPVTFPLSGAKDFFDQLHADNQHFVPIVDSALYVPNPANESDAYDTYSRGNESASFMTNPDGTQYIGAVWPGYTVFPDWLSQSAVSWWSNELIQWFKEVPYSGIWIDMSEVSSFCVGSCGTDNLKLNPVHPPFSLPGEPGNSIYEYPEGFEITNTTEAVAASAASSIQEAAKSSTATSSTTKAILRTTPTPGARNVNYPPYVINNVQGDLAVHAVSPNATHANGVQEYDVHNIFGHQILNATYQGLLKVFPGKRPFIIGRSTFAGSGKWSGHWGGDNASKWYYMYFSIPQALSFSLFGMPMFGVDTCGFNGNTDYELCSRWMQLSAFFPFYRNHNVLSAISQEPFRWESVASATRKAMHIRYSLLPYMYTLLQKAHTTGSTVMRALAWEFPNEPQLAGVDTQFLLGPSVLVTPVLEPQVDTVKGVFPGIIDGECWYDWYTQEKVEAEAGVNTTIAAPLGHIPVFIRGGSILPTQEPGYTTTASRKNPWGLLVALSADGTAAGELYVDDGESIDPLEYLSVKFQAGGDGLKADSTGNYKDTNALGTVTIMGVDGIGHVKLNGKSIPHGSVNYSEHSRVLKLTGLTNATSGGAWSRSWALSWG